MKYFLKRILVQGKQKVWSGKQKSKMANNFFMIKTTNLNTIFLKTLEKWM